MRMHQLHIREELSFKENSRVVGARLHRLRLKFRRSILSLLSRINFGSALSERRTTACLKFHNGHDHRTPKMHGIIVYPGPDTILGSPGLRHKYATGLPSRYHRYGAILRLEENHLPL